MCVEALLSVRAGMYSDCSVGLALFRYIYLNRDMRLCWGCYYSVTWHTCCLFLVLKAALQWTQTTLISFGFVLSCNLSGMNCKPLLRAFKKPISSSLVSLSISEAHHRN